MKSLANISIAEFQKCLIRLGLELKRTSGGHEMWAKEGMMRPVVIQAHVEPIPEFVVRNNLRALGLSKADFLALIESL